MRPQCLEGNLLLPGFVPTIVDDKVERSAFGGNFGKKFPVSLVSDKDADAIFLVLATDGVNINSRNIGVRILSAPILEAPAVVYADFEQRFDI